MANKRTYKKGDKVWVQMRKAGYTFKKHRALILAEPLSLTRFTHKLYFNIRYLDIEGIEAFQCIPADWVVGYVEE